MIVVSVSISISITISIINTHIITIFNIYNIIVVGMVNIYRYPCNKENSSCLTFPGKCSVVVV